MSDHDRFLTIRCCFLLLTPNISIEYTEQNKERERERERATLIVNNGATNLSILNDLIRLYILHTPFRVHGPQIEVTFILTPTDKSQVTTATILRSCIP